ncbi:hypothetical protein GALMADRAFT_881397 [Galerina marginata CBS 339.88]|uniref:Uncharacterized protein n=1 Tax=Galerina marginata (strain CBS 339.88) TaxID=685588 RepID=A0A067SIC1_GALM3|nr:hypothetical protein GALMADRAFT_881397 [Galerina marginata CBS 339.88]
MFLFEQDMKTKGLHLYSLGGLTYRPNRAPQKSIAGHNRWREPEGRYLRLQQQMPAPTWTRIISTVLAVFIRFWIGVVAR